MHACNSGELKMIINLMILHSIMRINFTDKCTVNEEMKNLLAEYINDIHLCCRYLHRLIYFPPLFEI